MLGDLHDQLFALCLIFDIFFARIIFFCYNQFIVMILKYIVLL